MHGFLPEAQADALRERFDAVCERLEKAVSESGRASGDIRLTAISKTHPAPVVAELCRYWHRGSPVFGENYMQEAVAKQAAVASLLTRALPATAPPEWHFTGHVQSRKGKDVAGRFALIHTLDSEKLAMQIGRAVAEKNLPPQPVLIQVNIGEEPQKFGVAAADAERLITAVLAMPTIHITGLMCLPPVFDDATASRPYFGKLRELRDTLARAVGLPLPELSMGMSHDFAAAVAEGATLVRIGTDIFGARPAKTLSPS